MEIKVVIEDVVPEKEYILMTKPDESVTFVEVMDRLGFKYYRPCGGFGKFLDPRPPRL